MTTNNADFKVKKGLKIEGGNIDFSNAQHATIDMDATTTTNGTGKNITIKAGLGDGTGKGGLVVLKTGGGTTGSGGGATSHVQALTIRESGDVHIGTNGLNATVTSSGSSINSTTVGDHTPASGKFTTLQATNSTTLVTLETTGAVNLNSGGTITKDGNADGQISGSAKGSGTNGSTLMDAEFRIFTNISTEDAGAAWSGYNGNTNLLVMENTQNTTMYGQGVAFTTGVSGTGSSWAVGRMRQTSGDSFTIGYRADSFDAIGYSNSGNNGENTANPLGNTNSLLNIKSTGIVEIGTAGAGRLQFVGHANGDTSTTHVQSIRASTVSTAANNYILPPAAPGGNGYVLASQTDGTLSWIAAAGGADGMGAGFTVSATTDTTATTITTGEDLFFAVVANGGLKAETTADGTVTHSLDIDGMTDINAAIVSGDLLIIDDGANGTNRKTTVDRIATALAGDGLAASGVSLTLDADQSGQITAVGDLTSLTTAAAASVDINGADVDITATTLSIDSTDTTNLTMTANSSSAKAMTIDAANSGSGAASISIGTTSATAINIGHTTSETTVNDNLTVTGNLTVNGTTTTVNSTTIELDDKNISLANGVGNDAAIDGGGITLISSGDDKTFNYVNANTAWTSSENFDIVSGKKYKLGGADIFTNATTLASGVVTSSLTTVGALNSGSITSGFTSIDVGSGAITTTGTITGGVLVADNLQLDGNVLSSTNSNGNIALTPNGTGLVNIAKDDLAIAGVAVTTTAAELNVLDAVTAGTVSASLALVVDSNKDLATIRNLTSNGTVQAAAVSVDAVAVLDTTRGSGASISGATAITSFATGTYTTAKYIYQIKKDTAVDTDVGEILITYEGTSDDVFILEYGMISTGTSIGAWSADFNSNSVRLIYTPANNGNHTYTILNTLLI